MVADGVSTLRQNLLHQIRVRPSFLSNQKKSALDFMLFEQIQYLLGLPRLRTIIKRQHHLTQRRSGSNFRFVAAGLAQHCRILMEPVVEPLQMVLSNGFSGLR